MKFLIYLDVCCLNRPFDDQTQERIRLEGEAIRLILDQCQTGDWQLVGSEVFDDELENTPEGARKEQMTLWAVLATTKITITEIETRSKQLSEMGFKDYDGMHIACAEALNADVLLTTDDRMLRLAARLRDLLQVRVENPLQWLQEVTNDRRE